MKENIALIISIITPGILFLSRNTILNWIKSSFTKEIEKFKHELDVQKEIIKQDLSKEAQKVSYLSTSKQALYPELYEKLRICEGAVGLLHGLRYGTDYFKLDNTDLEKLILNSKLYDSLKQSIISNLKIDRNEAIKQMQSEFRNLEFFKTKRYCQEAKNFVIIKSLYFTPTVRDLAFEIIKIMNSIIIDVEYMKETHTPYERIKEQQEEVETILTQIEISMRSEIFGSQT